MSPKTTFILRELRDINRALFKRAHKVYFFHDSQDPHSQLCLQIIPLIKKKFSVDIVEIPVSINRTEKENKYKYKDSLLLAAQWGLTPPNKSSLIPQKRNRNGLLKKLGHYQGGMFYYEGEWYWGLDRIHFLEKRLISLGLQKMNISLKKDKSKSLTSPKEIDFYFSFRSPYSYLALVELKKRKHLNINFKPVLPLVMRGATISSLKKIYIFKDAARLAEEKNIPFGKFMDPLGKGIINCLKVFPLAKEENKAFEYCLTLFESIWANGVDVSKIKNFQRILKPLEFDPEKIQDQIENFDPDPYLEKNKVELFALELWGVPSFTDGHDTFWGQDRIPFI